MGLNPNLGPWAEIWVHPRMWTYSIDGNIGRLHSRLRDTMVNREVPPEIMADVSEFLIQLEEEKNETSAECDIEETVDSEKNEGIKKVNSYHLFCSHQHNRF